LTKIPKEVMDLLTAPDTAKMLATVDAKGTPNVVPVWSLRSADPETIAFAEIFIKHTKENLMSTKKAAIAVFKGPMVGYQLKGTFVGFQTSGPLFDGFAKALREQMKLQIKSVGLIKVDEVFAASPGADSKKLA
jgi:hypothetical protein